MRIVSLFHQRGLVLDPRVACPARSDWQSIPAGASSVSNPKQADCGPEWIVRDVTLWSP